MTFLITAAEAVTLAFNDKNFLSGKILDAHLEVAHEALLRPALGDDFYEELTATTLAPGTNKTFVDTYLKRPLAFYVRYLILPEVMVHVSNTGLGMVQPQGTIAVTDRQAGVIRDQARQNAEVLLSKALAYLDENADDFPNYKKSETIRHSTKIIGGVIF